MAVLALACAVGARAEPDSPLTPDDPRLQKRELAQPARVDELESQIGAPERFERFADGSPIRRGVVASPPRLSPSAEPRSPRPLEKSLLPGTSTSPMYRSIPNPTIRTAKDETEGRATGVWIGAVLASTALWGYFAVRAARASVAGASGAAPPGPTPVSGPGILHISTAVASKPKSRWDALEPLPSADTPLPAEPTAYSPPAVDWPVLAPRYGTWRAIDWREQRLLDEWDKSSEKLTGKASFSEWLDAQAGSPGVDVALLKAKLARDV